VLLDGRREKLFAYENAAASKQNRDARVPADAHFDAYRHEMESLPFEERVEFCDPAFAEALTVYRALPVRDALFHNNPIIRMFAVLDRRVGKRTLAHIRSRAAREPEWLQPFCRLRFSAIGMPL
jgi:hypothetical protein